MGKYNAIKNKVEIEKSFNSVTFERVNVRLDYYYLHQAHILRIPKEEAKED